MNTHIPQSTVGTWEQWHPNSNEHTKHPGLGSQILFSTKKNQSSSEKWLIPGLEQEKYNMN